MVAKKIAHIIGGGTVIYARSHLAVSAPAYGSTARQLAELCRAHSDKLDVELHLTRMAGGSKGLETNDDVEGLVKGLTLSEQTKFIFFNAAMADFRPTAVTSINYIPDNTGMMGRTAPRLRSRDGEHIMLLEPTKKVVSSIRKDRKDIFLIAFKTTVGASEDEQYLAGLNLLKEASCNLVLANDVFTRKNMVITPEEARYHVTTDREAALKGLVRCHT